MAIKHKFVSSVANIGGATYVQPTHWNDDHNHAPILAAYVRATGGWVNQPSAYTVLTPTSAALGWYDFTYVDQVRVSARIGPSIGFASAQLMVQFSGDMGANWHPLATGATGPFVGIGSGAPASGIMTTKIGSWFAVNPSVLVASQGVILRVMGFMGDSSADPNILDVSLFVL